MSDTFIPRPLFDSAYKGASGLPGMSEIMDVEQFRQITDTTTAESVLEKHPHLSHSDIIVPAVKDFGDHSIILALFQTKTSSNKSRSVVLYAHGGGQVVGNRFFSVDQILGLVCPINEDIVFASVEYRRAPEHRAPAGAHDCYSALVHLVENAADLAIDPSKILVYGISGGAPLAAATCLLAKNRKGPRICAQLLNIPMLDDRDHYLSWKQFQTGTLWSGTTNRQAWDMILGANRDTSEVDEIQCPGRATDLTGLPPAFIDVGECEVFRDGAIAFASQIWKAGGSAELHVWPGMYHGATLFEPDVPASKVALAAQRDYIEKALGLRSASAVIVRDGAQALL